jgi:hypothetical protein
LAEVRHRRGEHADAGVAVFVVVPGEELLVGQQEGERFGAHDAGAVGVQ